MGDFFLFLAVAALYFLPWMIAEKRRHKNRLVISWMNFLLGWTGLFWLVCFFWSLTANTEAKGK